MKGVKFTKLVCIATIACLTAVVPVANAQETPEKPRKFSLLLGGGVSVIDGNVLGGGSFGIGFMPTPKQLLTFEFGASSDGKPQRIGSYSYYVSYNGGTPTQHDDGEITYQYTSMEAMLTWSRLFDLSERWQFRAGPSVGLMGISAGDHYYPRSYQGSKIEGLPDEGEQSVAKSTFTGGVIAGLRWNFAKRGSLELNYRLTANSGLHFPEREMWVLDQKAFIPSREFGTIWHRINLTFGWSLGRR